MRVTLLSLMILGLCACSSTTMPHYTPSQQQQSVDLAVLSQNSAAILTATAMPLHFYCQHHHWPQAKALDLTRPVLSNLLALSYQTNTQQQMLATFSLLSVENTLSNWRIRINKPLLGQKNQQVSTIIENSDYNIHLQNDVQLNCQNQPHDKS